MRIMRDFFCQDCGEISEEYIDQSVEITLCECGGISKKCVSAPASIKIGKFLSSIDGDAWAKGRIKQARRVAERDGPIG